MFMKLDTPLRAARRPRATGRDRTLLQRFVETSLPLGSLSAEHRSHNEDAILDLALCLILAATIIGLLTLHL